MNSVAALASTIQWEGGATHTVDIDADTVAVANTASVEEATGATGTISGNQCDPASSNSHVARSTGFNIRRAISTSSRMKHAMHAVSHRVGSV
jgi:hypothetical protein